MQKPKKKIATLKCLSVLHSLLLGPLFSLCICSIPRSGIITSQTPHSQRPGRDWRKVYVTPNWQVAGLTPRLVLGGHETSRPIPTAGILQVYMAVCVKFSHVYRHLPEGLNPLTISSLCPWKWLQLWGSWAEGTLQGQRRRWEASNCPPVACGSTHDRILSMTFLKSDEVLWLMKFTRFSLQLFLTEYPDWKTLSWSSCSCLPLLCWVCWGHVTCFFSLQASNQASWERI